MNNIPGKKKCQRIYNRKVLSVTVTEILIILSKEITILANLIAWPAFYLFTENRLKDFAYIICISHWIFILSVIIALVIALITAGYQTINAKITNPVKNLRYE